MRTGTSRFAARQSISLACALAVFGSVSMADEVLRPFKDGTLVDGGIFGPFDGVADLADWSFNESSFEGTITLSRTPLGLEHRVVWEFDLRNVQANAPVTAFLTFKLRGAAIFPADPAEVRIVAYPADLAETLADFDVPPSEVIKVISVAPFQSSTEYTVNVSLPVTAAMQDGSQAFGCRFEVDPATPGSSGQAFMDALDADPETKPSLHIVDRVPGDVDDDGDVDRDDVAMFGMCLSGPSQSAGEVCNTLDFDVDGDLDLADYQFMLRHFHELRP